MIMLGGGTLGDGDMVGQSWVLPPLTRCRPYSGLIKTDMVPLWHVPGAQRSNLFPIHNACIVGKHERTFKRRYKCTWGSESRPRAGSVTLGSGPGTLKTAQVCKPITLE